MNSALTWILSIFNGLFNHINDWFFGDFSLSWWQNTFGTQNIVPFGIFIWILENIFEKDEQKNEPKKLHIYMNGIMTIHGMQSDIMRVKLLRDIIYNDSIKMKRTQMNRRKSV